MRKSLLLGLIGLAFLVMPAGIVIYGHSVYNTAQCIASFEGQESLICRTGGSSRLSALFLCLSLMGVVLLVIGFIEYFRRSNH